MINLTLGVNTIINHKDIIVKISSDLPVDASAFRLFANNKVKDDLDMVFHGQPNNENGSISWKQDHNKNHEFIVNLSKLANDVTKVAFTITCDEYQTISQLSNLSIQIIANNQVIAVGEVDITDRPEKALIMGEIYRRNSEWKFRFIAQGFNGGLKPLAENFGVNIVDEENSSKTKTNQVRNSNSSSKVNLNKISLSKDKTTVSLDKQDNYGMIGINLNWNQTDATVSVQVLGQPEIETQLTEGNNKNRLCAIVQLKNDKGAIKIQRLNKYFRGQRELAHAYHWDFRWQAGRK